VEDLRGFVDALVEQALDRCAEQGTFDFIGDFADHIPVAVICELLGVPKEDIGKFKEWTFKVTSMTGIGITDADVARADAAMTKHLSYLSDLLAERQRDPRDDLLSNLIWARDQGQQLTESETLGLAFLLLAAGSDTTTAFLGGAALALLRNRDQLELLRAQPELMPRAVEELLRFEGPVHFGLIRTTTEALHLDGAEVPAGERIWTILPAANRDPDAFPDPDALVLGRDGPPHLSFGQGVHVCLGAGLARLEASVALQRLLERFPRLELAESGNPWASHGNLRRMDHLAVAGSRR
jgi:cytochrome P450